MVYESVGKYNEDRWSPHAGLQSTKREGLTERGTQVHEMALDREITPEEKHKGVRKRRSPTEGGRIKRHVVG